MANSTGYDHGQPLHYLTNTQAHSSSLLASLDSVDTDVALSAHIDIVAQDCSFTRNIRKERMVFLYRSRHVLSRWHADESLIYSKQPSFPDVPRNLDSHPPRRPPEYAPNLQKWGQQAVMTRESIYLQHIDVITPTLIFSIRCTHNIIRLNTPL